MKKILFVIDSLGIGGAEKSLVTLLSMLDYSRYDVYLKMFRNKGGFLSQVPEQVHILPEDEKLKFQSDNFKTAWIKYLLSGDIRRCIHSLLWLCECFFCKFILHKDEYLGWHHQTHLHSRNNEKYDAAVAYLEKFSTYYVADMVCADKKTAYMHTDYNSIPHNIKLDENSYKKIDYLAVVSEHTKETMIKYFGFMKDKTVVIKNIISSALIKKLSEEYKTELVNSDADLKIVSVGRLTKQKGFDIAVEILSEIRKSGIDAEWYIIGDGEEKCNLERLIKNSGLEGRFHLLGSKVNPYPYIKECDIYIQPSRWEGYGITVAEAKCLNKPIVVSDIPEFREQIKDNINGCIAGNIKSFSEKTIKIYNDSEFRYNLQENLKAETISTEPLEKFMELLEK